MPHFHAFLSSLVQLTSTILSILLAALSAYYVYLEDKTAHFADQIQANKLEIGDALKNLVGNWPQDIAMYLPVEFRDEYRSKYPEKGGLDFVEQAARDVLFLNAPLVQAIEHTREKEKLGGPWQGRAYFWVLDEAVGSLTLASRYTESNPRNVFPWSMDGPGFEQWRQEFRKVRGILSVLADYQPQMLLDFQQFVQTLPQQYKTMNLATHYQRGTETFFKQLRLVGNRLDEIDKYAVSAKQYSFWEKVQVQKILILCAIAIIAGILFPQSLLAHRSIPVIFGKLLFLVSVTSLGLASLQFARDISMPVTIDWESYIDARWYEPILRQVQHQKARFDNGGMINAEYCIEAVRSEDSAHFDHKLLDAIKKYVASVDGYNKAAQAFNHLALNRMRQDTVIQAASRNFKSLRGRATFYPYYLIDERKWNAFKNAAIRKAEGDISVEVWGPSWSRTEFQIPGHLFTQVPSKLLIAMEVVGSSVKSEPEAKDFMKVRESMSKTSDYLTEVLAGLTRNKP